MQYDGDNYNLNVLLEKSIMKKFIENESTLVRLVSEFSVWVRSEESFSHLRQIRFCQHVQTCFQSVRNLDKGLYKTKTLRTYGNGLADVAQIDATSAVFWKRFGRMDRN